ncbi:MAG: hypothetical protein M1827_001781 [Pycnora praestabilis]|nr:MAG: hypothetical protein M1827_001781 [Pycnora praestabilis]
MGVEPPFIYDRPSQPSFSSPYGNFNPKAVSQASLAPSRPRSTQKQDGPLVSFNKHPDSYLILPYGNIDAKPMSRRTRKKVKYIRWLQLFLRCSALLGAVGLLVCVICVKGVQDSVGWIIRVAPGVAILHCIYAIYHLARGAAGRTPASSASYHLFAGCLDAGLVACYVFSALISETQHQLGDDVKYKWGSVFTSTNGTDTIINTVFLFSVINGGIHLVSLLFCIYLAITFRKISKLPPDMNPLEDNLTSRHRKKNSTISEILSEKRGSQNIKASTLSGVTASKHDLNADDPLLAAPRTMPFMHTRTESTETFLSAKTSQSRPNGHRNSRPNPPSQIYQQNESTRVSCVDIDRNSGYSPPSKRSTLLSSCSRPPTAKSSANDSLLSENWYVLGTTPEDESHLARTASVVSSLKSWELRRANPNEYQPVQQAFNDIPNPLFSNPPTPPQPRYDERVMTAGTPSRALTPGTPNRMGTPGGLSRANTPKARFYGNLKPGTPPIMGTYVDLPRQGAAGARVISNSGADYGYGKGKRDVSGKVAEEGRSPGWARFRNVSGS